MIKLFSHKKTEKLISECAGYIEEASVRYGVPASMIRAILYREMTEIDLVDVLADLAVYLAPGLVKKDSSTGYAQIYGYVGLNALNLAVDRGLTTYEEHGIRSVHRLDPKDPADVRKVWLLLSRDRKENIAFAAMNLLSCALEMTGGTDFNACTEEELCLILTRYNANVRHVTKYGEDTLRYMQRYQAAAGEPRHEDMDTNA